VSHKQTFLSKEFINKTVEFSAGYIPQETLDTFFNVIEKEIIQHYFTYSSESNLLRIITGMFDKVSFINECIKYPHYIELLILVSVNSNYLTDILVRNPEYFYYIVNPTNLERKAVTEDLRNEIRNSVSQYNSFNAKVNTFRRIKRREILRIGLKDLMKAGSFQEITFELSILAKTIIDEIFKLCYEETLKKYNIDAVDHRYCITALGKLGGDELNYSSDVDLIIFFDNNSKLNNKKEYQEILTEAVHLFIENCTLYTSSGYIYRIDLRLRPDGRNSPLCRTLSEYLLYYESKGEDWERQMLLKASFAGGSKELYDDFIKYLQPFIYPLSFSVSPTEQIYKLKVNIEKNLLTDDNIKLSSGGIRDIEFSVQALQLINGGRNKEIRTGNTLEAIRLLNLNNLLGEEEAEIFNNAYLIYRYSEHFLQLMNDKQTHIIPETGELLEKLSYLLKYKTVREFKRDLIIKRTQVKKIYSSIMGIRDESQGSIFKKIIFENRKKAENDLLFLREGKGVLGIREFDKNSIELFQKIEPNLVKYLESSTRPDIVLQNFARIMKDIPFPSIWYREFTDKSFYYSFLKICEFSQKTVDLFAEDQELQEYYISRRIFERIDKTECSRYPVKKLLYILSVQFTLGKINSSKFGKILQANLAEKIQSSGDELIQPGNEYFIAGLGSFGDGEMNFSSDIDLIFIVKEESVQFELQKSFQNLLLRLKKILQPFETDCRLRPEGKSSQLVWNLKSYEHYLKNRVRIWELQSLCKLRFVSGDKRLFNTFKNLIIERIKEEKSETIKSEIIAMRRKLLPSSSISQMQIINLKKVPGGIIDIDFSIQYLMLTNHEIFHKLLNAGTEKRIILLFPDIKDLKENYIFLKDLILRNQCIFSSSGYLFKENEKENIIYKKELHSILQANNKLFNKIMGN
jgi:[glutamine synthetase] adenylyltransferase / [glutamine synthetase]-adenylyl-L-tyrosine phosphorylase